MKLLDLALTILAAGMSVCFAFFFNEVADLNGLGFAIAMQSLLVVTTLTSAYYDYKTWKNK